MSWCSSTSDNEVRVEVNGTIKILALRARTTYTISNKIRDLSLTLFEHCNSNSQSAPNDQVYARDEDESSPSRESSRSEVFDDDEDQNWQHDVVIEWLLCWLLRSSYRTLVDSQAAQDIRSSVPRTLTNDHVLDTL